MILIMLRGLILHYCPKEAIFMIENEEWVE